MNQPISPSSLSSDIDELTEVLITSDRTFFTADCVRQSLVQLSKAIEGTRADAMVITGQHEALTDDGLARP